jgi:hypothetical protein
LRVQVIYILTVAISVATGIPAGSGLESRKGKAFVQFYLRGHHYAAPEKVGAPRTMGTML